MQHCTIAKKASSSCHYKVSCSEHDIAGTNFHFALNNNQSANHKNTKTTSSSVNRHGITMVIIEHLIDCVFESRSYQTKDNKIDTFCFKTKHASLRSKSLRVFGSESCVRVERPVDTQTVVSVNSYCKNPTKRVRLV